MMSLSDLYSNVTSQPLRTPAFQWGELGLTFLVSAAACLPAPLVRHSAGGTLPDLLLETRQLRQPARDRTHDCSIDPYRTLSR